MSQEQNNKIIADIGHQEIYLLDSSAIIRFEELYQLTGINLLSEIKNSNNIEYLVTNEVAVELLNGPRIFEEHFYLDKMVNAEHSANHSVKENRFLIEVNGQICYTVQNKVSQTDYGQILFCQNHESIRLVSNDKKLMKSAQSVIGKRIVNIFQFIEKTSLIESENEKISKLAEECKKHFKLKKIN